MEGRGRRGGGLRHGCRRMDAPKIVPPLSHQILATPLVKFMKQTNSSSLQLKSDSLLHIGKVDNNNNFA